MLRPLFLFIESFFERKWFIISLIIINLLGSIYGFYWYKNQLMITPSQWLIFVPDSPLSSSFFTVFLILYYFRKKSPLIEALAAITSFKYGMWATIIIIWGNSITWVDIMLMTSHLGMAVEAVLFYKKYSYQLASVLIAGAWIIVNDFVDYSQDVHPWLPTSLSTIDHTVGYFTISLSVFTIILFYLLNKLRKKA